MKKNDVFTFTAPNGVEVTGIAVCYIDSAYTESGYAYTWLCYAQNRLITIHEMIDLIKIPLNPPVNGFTWKQEMRTSLKYGKVLVDYCILPDYDTMLERCNDLQVAQAETASGM